jgi:hypothetical protein
MPEPASPLQEHVKLQTKIHVYLDDNLSHRRTGRQHRAALARICSPVIRNDSSLFRWILAHREGA